MMMFDRAMIQKLLAALNDELMTRNVQGEIGLCGGAVMCLVFKSRAATKDIDGIFAPTEELRRAAQRVAQRHHLPDDWLNDAAKSYFLSEPPRVPVMELSHLRVWAPTAAYMLAMKCISARFDTHDLDDVRFLMQHLGLTAPRQVFAIIEKYYPAQQIPPKTQFVVEELLVVS